LAIDVGSAPDRVGPVLLTVELHTDFPLLISHVDSGEWITECVTYHDLRFWFGQPGVDEEEPRPSFLRRLCTAVH